MATKREKATILSDEDLLDKCREIIRAYPEGSKQAEQIRIQIQELEERIRREKENRK